MKPRDEVVVVAIARAQVRLVNAGAIAAHQNNFVCTPQAAAQGCEHARPEIAAGLGRHNDIAHSPTRCEEWVAWIARHRKLYRVISERAQVAQRPERELTVQVAGGSGVQVWL